MATAETQAPQSSHNQQSRKEVATDSASALLEKILAESPQAIGSTISRALTGEHINRVRDLLPESLKNDAERFVKRACLYFDRKPELAECTLPSKIKCILDAAEMGLAIDGKLCHAVSYNNKYKDDKKVERWRKEVQCQPDYKGLIVVAKRTGQIAGAVADVVCANDHFRHGRSGPSCILEHTYPIGEDRGEVLAAYAVFKLPANDWAYDIMQIGELDAIKRRSKSKDREGNPVGPWVSDTNEMRKKTVIRRMLKMYCDDPGVAKAIELDEREYVSDAGAWIPPQQGKVRVSGLGHAIDLVEQNGNSRVANGDDSNAAGPDRSGEESQGNGNGTHEHTHAREPGDESDPDFSEHGLTTRLADCDLIGEVMELRQVFIDQYGTPPPAWVPAACDKRMAELTAAKSKQKKTVS